MATTKLNAAQVREDTLTDADNDTLVQVEEGNDEDMIRFDTAGTQRMIIADDGNVGIGLDAPSSTLTVYADASNEYVALIDNDQSSAGHGLKITSDGNGAGTYLLDLESVSTTLFRFRGDGRLGIGTTTPGQTLTVEGDIGIGTQLVHKGDSDTFIEFGDDEINIEVGGRQMIKMEEAGTDKIILNNDQANVDLQVKSDGHANILRTDAANDRVGIATNSPGSTFEVVGSVSFPVGTLRTGAYTITEDDFCIVADCNSSAFSFTLPVATDAMAGRIYTIKRLDSGGSGGGGQGGDNGTPGGNTAGTANTGGGGGGGSYSTGSDGGSGIILIKDPDAQNDMTLISNAVTAESAPTIGDLVITFTNGVGTATINTDIKAYISRDGSDYTDAVTLVDQGDTGGHTILTANGVDLTGETSGTSMRWKIETLNQSVSKDTRIQAVSLGWS